MKYKAIFMDVDRTLLNSEHLISDKNKEAIMKAGQMGVKIVICSGRSYVSSINFVKHLEIMGSGNYISSFNGAIIVSTDGINSEIVYQENLGKKEAILIIEELKKHKLDIIIYKDPQNTLIEKETDRLNLYYSISKMNYEIVSNIEDSLTDDPIKVLALGDNAELNSLSKRIKTSMDDHINTFFSIDTMLEFTSKNVSKGNSLKYICRELNIDPSESIAIGDNHNDISMITQAGLGVAVANAVEEAKACADYITKSTNDESAIAEVINKFILCER